MTSAMYFFSQFLLAAQVEAASFDRGLNLHVICSLVRFFGFLHYSGVFKHDGIIGLNRIQLSNQLGAPDFDNLYNP